MGSGPRLKTVLIQRRMQSLKVIEILTMLLSGELMERRGRETQNGNAVGLDSPSSRNLSCCRGYESGWEATTMLRKISVLASALAIALLASPTDAQVGVGVSAGTALTRVRPRVSVSLTVGKPRAHRRHAQLRRVSSPRVRPTLACRTCVIGRCPPSCQVRATMVSTLPASRRAPSPRY
jgi:hypothetical protein